LGNPFEKGFPKPFLKLQKHYQATLDNAELRIVTLENRLGHMAALGNVIPLSLIVGRLYQAELGKAHNDFEGGFGGNLLQKIPPVPLSTIASSGN
jgi:hypothetical protein